MQVGKSKNEQSVRDIPSKDKSMDCTKQLTTLGDEPKHHATKMVVGMMWLHRWQITMLKNLEEQIIPAKKAAYNKHCIYTKKMRGREARISSEPEEARERETQVIGENHREKKSSNKTPRD